MTFKHTAVTDARIRKGYEAGERVREIGRALGISKDAVIGRARRLGLAVAGRQYLSPFSGIRDSESIAASTARSVAYNENRKANHSAKLRLEPAE